MIDEQQMHASIIMGHQEWEIIATESNRLLVITRHIIGIRPYDPIFENETWETCQLRRYLNTAFYSSFSRSEKQRILKTNNHNEKNPVYDTMGGNNTSDYIFVLSLSEIDQYMTRISGFDPTHMRQIPHCSLLSDQNDAKRVSLYRDCPVSWWLRCPGENSGSAVAVLYDGRIALSGIDLAATVDLGGVGVRPAMWIKDV